MRYVSVGSENLIEITWTNDIKFAQNKLRNVNSKLVLEDGILLTYCFEFK